MSYLGEVLADSPVGYWRLGDTPGSGTMSDSSGNGRHGVNVALPAGSMGLPGALPGDSNTSVQHNGGSYSEVAYGAWLDFQEFTLECWVNSSGIGALDGPVITRDGEVGVDVPFTMLMHSTYGFIVYVVKGGVNYWRGTSDWTQINDGAWHHVVATHSPTLGLRVYVDGTEILDGPHNAPPAGPLDTSQQSFRVAHSSDFDGRYYSGNVDEVAIYNVALSPERIQAHWLGAQPAGRVVQGEAFTSAATMTDGVVDIDEHFYVTQVRTDNPVAYWTLAETSGTFFDKSGNGKTLTPVNTPTLGSPGPFKGHKAVALNGTTQHLASNVPINHADWTVEFWYKGTDTDGVIASSRGAGRSITVYLGQVPVTGSPAGSVGVGVSSDSIWWGVYTTTARINDDRWHHVVAVWDGTWSAQITTAQFKIYIDGASAALTNSTYSTVNAPVNSAGTGYSFGGGTTDGPNRLSGSLSNIALYDYPLLSGRVLAHYWAGGIKVSGTAWRAEDITQAGTPKTEVIVRGQSWVSHAQTTMPDPIVLPGESWSSAIALHDGTPMTKAPLRGDQWVVQASPPEGLAKAEIIIRGDRWISNARTNTGQTFIEPEPPPIITDAEYETGVYKYFVFDILTDELLAEVQMSDVSFSTKLAAVGELSGTVFAVEAQPDVDLYWATMPMKTAIYVLRGDRAMWGGIIWNREYDAATQQVRISAGTWESYLYRRYIWHTFTTADDVDQYHVVRRLLTNMRNDFTADFYDTSNDNVTPLPMSAALDIYSNSNAVAGKTQDPMTFVREDMKSFGEAIEEYAGQEDGFEWFFLYEYNKRAGRFRRRLEYLPTPPSLMKKGSEPLSNTEADKPGVDSFLFEYPGNIITVTLVEDADNAATRQFVVGGPPEGITLEGFKPIGSWNNMTMINKGFPLVENVEASKHATTSKKKRLNRLARIYGQESSPPLRRWSITVNGSMFPIVGTYHVGHWCRLIMKDPFIEQSLSLAGQNQQVRGVVKRIVGITVNVPTGPQLPETVTLELEDDVVTTWEPADTVDEEGTPLPAAPITLYPTGNLIGQSVGAAGSPAIVGTQNQWSDSSSATWGELTSWQAGNSASYASNVLRAAFGAQTVETSGRTAVVKLTTNAVDAQTPLPYVIQIRNKTTNELCLTASPSGIASTADQSPQWTMTPTGGGMDALGQWLASGDAEIRVEAGHKPGPSPTGVDTKYRLHIYEARLVIN